MKLYSPDGSSEVDAHPSKVESMINLGWTQEKKGRAKPQKAPEPIENVEPKIKSDKESE
jgi:hypothetical protein